MSAAKDPLHSGEPVSWNFKLLSQNNLGGFGGMGEGMAVQIAKDGRRIMWLAHESAPKNFTGVDVSDPRNPKVVVQTDLPHATVRSNSLELSGDILAVAYQTQKKGQQPAGFELFDVSVPEKPKSISFFDCSGATSRGVHQLWFCDGEYVHMAAGSPDFEASNPNDDQFYRCIDVRDPSKPKEVGRWWLSGTRKGDNVAPPPRHTMDKGYRAHNCNVYPQRPDRMYLCYLDGGMYIMDIADKSQPKVISHWTNSPPYTGFTHTAVPLFDRGLVLVTEESTEDNAKDWPKLIWMLDVRDETHPVSFSTLPMPPVDAYKNRGAASVRTTSMRTCRCRPPSSRTNWCSAPSSTAACALSTFRTRTSRRKSRPSCRRRRTAPSSAPSSSTTSMSTSGRSFTRSTVFRAASISSRWISRERVPFKASPGLADRRAR